MRESNTVWIDYIVLVPAVNSSTSSNCLLNPSYCQCINSEITWTKECWLCAHPAKGAIITLWYIKSSERYSSNQYLAPWRACPLPDSTSSICRIKSDQWEISALINSNWNNWILSISTSYWSHIQRNTQSIWSRKNIKLIGVNWCQRTGSASNKPDWGFASVNVSVEDNWRASSCVSNFETRGPVLIIGILVDAWKTALGDWIPNGIIQVW